MISENCFKVYGAFVSVYPSGTISIDMGAEALYFDNKKEFNKFVKATRDLIKKVETENGDKHGKKKHR